MCWGFLTLFVFRDWEKGSVFLSAVEKNPQEMSFSEQDWLVNQEVLETLYSSHQWGLGEVICVAIHRRSEY